MIEGPWGTVFDADVSSSLVRILALPPSSFFFCRNAVLTLVPSWSIHVAKFLRQSQVHLVHN